MTGALALLMGAVLVCVQGPRVLLPMTRHASIDPHVTMVAWLASVLSVVITAVAGIIFLGLPGHGDLGQLLGRLNSCWSALSHGALPSWEQFFALMGVLALAAIAARLAVVAAAQTRIRKTRREKYRFLLALVATTSRESPQIVWLDSAKLLAFSLSGRPGIIVATQGLREQLTPGAVTATLEHERAHLRGRHQLILDVVDALAAALPIAPLFRAAPIALRELIELAADNAAVRRCGSAAVGDALRAVTAGPEPGTGLAMAGTATARRLQRLDSGRGVSTGPVRSLFCALTAISATALPAVLGLALLLSAACSVG
jgi:Zn-dependent protease with chaperone function